MKPLALVLAVVLALAAAGCGSKKHKTTPASTGTTKTAKKNKQFKAPATPQAASAKKKPTKATFKAVPKAKKAHQAKSPQLRGVEGLTIEQKLQMFANDTGAFWQSAFTSAGAQFTPATVNIVESPITNGCGVTVPPDYKYSADYCTTDRSLSLPVQTLNTLDQDQRFGDVVVAADVAVAYGFHVLNLVGLNTSSADQAALLESALCLGGVYTSTLQNRFDPGDIDKLQAGFPDKGGSSASNVNAFVVGFSSGSAAKCEAPGGGPGVSP